MPDATTNPELLRSLGRLARGLSALFWGLPAALLTGAGTARADGLKPLGMLPVLVVNALLVFGVWQLSRFQKQERPWRTALDRVRLLAVVILGLSPFIYWHNQVPEQPYFGAMVLVLELVAVLFLYCLNQALQRLGAMLPDETLRQETRQFTALNRWLLVILLAVTVVATALLQLPHPSAQVGHLLVWLNRGSRLLLIFFVLLPLAMTMALIWKTKEVILDAVFGAR